MFHSFWVFFSQPHSLISDAGMRGGASLRLSAGILSSPGIVPGCQARHRFVTGSRTIWNAPGWNRTRKMVEEWFICFPMIQISPTCLSVYSGSLI